MAGPVEPPELAQLLDFEERSRTGDWSLRSALCRYAQPDPARVSALLDLVRRVEPVLGAEHQRLAGEGAELWAALQGAPVDGEDQLVGLLRVLVELDALGDVLAEWAEDWRAHHPEGAVDDVVRSVGDRLEALGVPEQERIPPPGARSRG